MRKAGKHRTSNIEHPTPKERTIIFSGPMVRAILEGRKSQTRRVAKAKRPDGVITGPASEPGHAIESSGGGRGFNPHVIECVECPYGTIGGRLWVRETWCCKMDCGEFVYKPNGNQDCYYRATETEHIIKDDGDGGTAYRLDGCEASPWQSPLFMPRWASRITLEITGIRVERLQDISDADAQAEGIFQNKHGVWHWTDDSGIGGASPSNAYAQLWALIHGDHQWERNPWVWVLEFKRLEL